MSLKISIVYGSTRLGRLGIRLAKYITNEINSQNFEATLIDPLEYNFPLLFKRLSDYHEEEKPKKMLDLQSIFNDTDAFILVSAEYNHMPPPALINLINYYSAEYNRKISTVCTYSSGDFAGVRVQSPLRAMLTQLGCPCIKYGMFQPNIAKNFNENGRAIDPVDAKKRFNIFFNELVWYAKALKKERA